MNVRRLAHAFLARLGYELRRCPPTEERADFVATATGCRTNLAEAYRHILNKGFQPATVIDIGVAGGTPELYSTFPDSYFLLVEALSQFEPQIQSILEKYQGAYVLAAAGAEAGHLEINVHDHQPDASSLYQETMGSMADGHKVRVPVVRLDDIVEEQSLRGPFLLKIDVQGAEIDVLAGSPTVIEQCEAIVLEVSLFQFLKGAPEFADVIAHMRSKGFVVYDIIPGWNRPLDDALGQCDIVFVREHGQFRRDHSYMSAEQFRSAVNGI